MTVPASRIWISWKAPPTRLSTRKVVSSLELSVQLRMTSVVEAAWAARPLGAAGAVGPGGGGGGGRGVVEPYVSRATAVWRRVMSCPSSLPRGACSPWAEAMVKTVSWRPKSTRAALPSAWPARTISSVAPVFSGLYSSRSAPTTPVSAPPSRLPVQVYWRRRAHSPETVPSPITAGSMSLKVWATLAITSLGFRAGSPSGASPVSSCRRLR